MALGTNSAVYIWAVRVYLDASYTDDADIGLDGNQLRWSEVPLTGSTVAWTPGIMLSEGAIGNLLMTADLRWGGDVEDVGGTTIRLDNTGDYASGAGYPLSRRLAEAGIRLQTRMIEIVRFTAATSAGTGSIVYRGVIDSVEYSATQMVLTVSAVQRIRNADMGTYINTTEYPDADPDSIGNMLPITFGEIVPEGAASFGPMAKGIRTKTGETILTNYLDADNYALPLARVFPVTLASTAPSTAYVVKVGNSSVGEPFNHVAGMYLRVVEGGSSDGTYNAAGECRRIVSVTASGEDYIFGIAAPFSKELSGNATATAAYQAWVEIVDIPLTYTLDTWPCGGFYQVGGAVSNTVEPYSWDTDSVKYLELPRVFDVVDTDYNETTWYTDFLKGDSVSVTYVESYPMTDVSLYDSADDGVNGLSMWEASAGEFATALKRDAGLYVHLTSGYTYAIITELTDKSTAIDRDGDTYYRTEADVVSTDNALRPFWHALSMTLPPKPDFSFDSVSLGISAGAANNSLLTTEQPALYIRYRRWMGLAKEILSGGDNWYDTGSLSDLGHMGSVPLAHYTTPPPTSENYDYLFNNRTLTGLSLRHVTGYQNFELTGIDATTYDGIHSIGVILKRTTSQGSIGGCTSRVDVRDACMTFQKTVDLSKEIHTPFKGRIFNDTWGSGRKTPADVMTNPIDILEHACRLQNWSEGLQSWETAYRWGKEYSPDALIVTNSTTKNDGAFDTSSTVLQSVTAKCGFQIFDKGKATTLELKRAICRDHFLCSYTTVYNNMAYLGAALCGKEAVEPIALRYTDYGLTSSLAAINLTQVVGEIPPLIEPTTADLFCEPVIRYAYNAGSGAYGKAIRLTNTQAATYAAGYVLGDVSATVAETLWNMGRALYNYCNVITPPPDEMVESPTIYRTADALQKMMNWFFWMGVINGEDGIVIEPRKRLQITVPYSVAINYHLMTRVSVNLPHQTSGTAIEGIVEELEHNLTNNTTDLRIILLGNTENLSYFIKDTYGTGVSPEWKDTYGTGEGEDIKDSY